MRQKKTWGCGVPRDKYFIDNISFQIRYRYFLVKPQCFIVLCAKSGKPVVHLSAINQNCCRSSVAAKEWGNVGHEIITNFMARCALRHMKVENCKLTVEK